MASTTRSYCRTVIPISHFHCRRLNRSFASTLRKAIASNIFLLVREFRGWCGMTRHQIRFNRIVYTIVADSLSLLSSIILSKRCGRGATTCEFRRDLEIVKRRWQLLSTDNRSGPLKDPFLCFLLQNLFIQRCLHVIIVQRMNEHRCLTLAWQIFFLLLLYRVVYALAHFQLVRSYSQKFPGVPLHFDIQLWQSFLF